MLQALSSEALKPLLPSSDISVRVRPALTSSVRSVSRSLPRYHHVEMPIPMPNVPIAVFSCQKQPASLSTTLVKSDEPITLVTSASVTPLQGSPRNPTPVTGAAGRGAWSGPHAVRAMAQAAASAASHLADVAPITDPKT